MNKEFTYFAGGHRDVVPQVTSEEQLVQAIVQNASVKDFTEKHRHFQLQGNEKSAKFYKSLLPCFAVAVTFKGGKREEHIVSYTHVSLADIDEITPEEARRLLDTLRKNPHVRLAYITASGGGLRIIFSYTLEDGTDLNRLFKEDRKKAKKLYTHVFTYCNEYFRKELGLKEIDQKCKDCTRVSGIAHCPEVYYNPDAQPIVVPPMPGKKKTAGKQHKHSTTLTQALPYVYENLSQKGIVYEPGSRNKYICQAGYMLNSYGVPLNEAVEWAGEHFADYDDLPCAADIIRSCYKRTDEHGSERLPGSQTGGKYISLDEMENFLSSQAEYRYNIITRKCELRWKGHNDFEELTDRDANSLWRRINKSAGQAQLYQVYSVLQSEFVPLFNPFETYFSNLPKWDGKTDYIGRLAATVHVSNGKQELFADYFRRWLVAMVCTLLDHRVVNHEILVLVGKQGVYKTTWLRHLLPPELQRYFYTKSNSNRFTKDDQFTLTETAIMCYEEIETMSRSEMNQLKALTTLDSINERAAYGRYKERRPHIASFCATGNSLQFLNDDSGNRRFLTFEVEKIDNPYLNPVDYVGVYSQANALRRNGFRYWFEQEEIEEINLNNRYFEVPNIEEELIFAHYAVPMPGADCIFQTTSNILERISAAIKQPLNAVKIGRAMKKLGFKSKTFQHQRGFLVIERTPEQVRQSLRNLGHYLNDSSPDTPAEE